MAGTGGAFGGSRGMQPVPPEKGVFPLDHFGECTQEMKAYMDCLRSHGSESGRCKELAKAYLVCRMERGLMAKQDLSELGFKQPSSNEETASSASEPQKTDVQPKRERESKGFVGGTGGLRKGGV